MLLKCCCWWFPLFVKTGVFTCIVTVVQSVVSQCMEKDRQGLRGATEQRAGQERGAVLKGYPLSATLAKGITPCCRLFSISG